MRVNITAVAAIEQENRGYGCFVVNDLINIYVRDDTQIQKAFDKKRSCKIFLINGIDTKCDTPYNIDKFNMYNYCVYKLYIVVYILV